MLYAIPALAEVTLRILTTSSVRWSHSPPLLSALFSGVGLGVFVLPLIALLFVFDLITFAICVAYPTLRIVGWVF